MNQLKFLTSIFFLFALLTSCDTKQEEVPQKPNILFIAVDDLRIELGCYGNEHIQSPNLDKLASQGFLFTRHYVGVPT